MSEHTPGPWSVDGPPHNQIVWSDSENRVCFLAHSNGKNPERDIANGRLIAAAPDLLAACIELTDQLALLAKDPKTNPWVCQGRAAISKAEGVTASKECE